MRSPARPPPQLATEAEDARRVRVMEQPAFWDIRDEMSTHDGRMVATDDALMLFSDPTEAMQELMS